MFVIYPQLLYGSELRTGSSRRNLVFENHMFDKALKLVFDKAESLRLRLSMQRSFRMHLRKFHEDYKSQRSDYACKNFPKDY